MLCGGCLICGIKIKDQRHKLGTQHRVNKRGLASDGKGERYMSIIFALVRCALFGAAGWFLYSNPVRILNFVFGKDESQQRPVRFFKTFGIIMIVLAGISAVITVVYALLKTLA